MATLKQQAPSSPQLVSEYRGKTVVFLEGETDVNLFRNYWFKHRLDKLDFTEPKIGFGCVGVVDNVINYRRNGIPAFGLVDRDKLQADQHWNLAWETDNAAFHAARPYGSHVWITRYWEIESYLIEPSVIEAYVSHRDGGRAQRPQAEAEFMCLTHAEALIPHAALNAAKQKHGEPACGDGQTSSFPSRQKVEQEWERLKESGKITPEVWADYVASLPKVEAFATGATPREKLVGLLRCINGKALLHRIQWQHRLQDDPTFFLADMIYRSDAVPLELRDFVETCCRAPEAA